MEKILKRHKDNLILIAGNGGSMVNAIHLALHLQDCGYRAISLSDPAIITARGNDFGMEDIFSSQISALGKQGHLFIAISGSGKSPDILVALQAAEAWGLSTFVITMKKPYLALHYNGIGIDTEDMGIFEDKVSELVHQLKEKL